MPGNVELERFLCVGGRWGFPPRSLLPLGGAFDSAVKQRAQQFLAETVPSVSLSCGPLHPRGLGLHRGRPTRRRKQVRPELGRCGHPLPPVGDPVTQCFRPNHFAPDRSSQLIPTQMPLSPGASHSSYTHCSQTRQLRVPPLLPDALLLCGAHETECTLLSPSVTRMKQAPAPQACSMPPSWLVTPVLCTQTPGLWKPRPPREARQQHAARRRGPSPRPCNLARARGP